MTWLPWIVVAAILAFAIRGILKSLSPKENLKRHIQETYYEDPEDKN